MSLIRLKWPRNKPRSLLIWNMTIDFEVLFEVKKFMYLTQLTEDYFCMNKESRVPITCLYKKLEGRLYVLQLTHSVCELGSRLVTNIIRGQFHTRVAKTVPASYTLHLQSIPGP